MTDLYSQRRESWTNGNQLAEGESVERLKTSTETTTIIFSCTNQH